MVAAPPLPWVWQCASACSAAWAYRRTSCGLTCAGPHSGTGRREVSGATITSGADGRGSRGDSTGRNDEMGAQRCTEVQDKDSSATSGTQMRGHLAPLAHGVQVRPCVRQQQVALVALHAEERGQ